MISFQHICTWQLQWEGWPVQVLQRWTPIWPTVTALLACVTTCGREPEARFKMPWDRRKAHGITNRTVHVVDSLGGLPQASDSDNGSWSVSKDLERLSKEPLLGTGS